MRVQVNKRVGYGDKPRVGEHTIPTGTQHKVQHREEIDTLTTTVPFCL